MTYDLSLPALPYYSLYIRNDKCCCPVATAVRRGWEAGGSTRRGIPRVSRDSSRMKSSRTVPGTLQRYSYVRGGTRLELP